MIRNEKAQALIEFVLILPVILILFLGMIDLGRIVIRKTELDSLVTDKINIWKNSDTNVNELKGLLEDDNINVKITKNNDTNFVTIDLYESVTFLTPIVSNILGDYTIHVKRVIPNE